MNKQTLCILQSYLKDVKIGPPIGTLFRPTVVLDSNLIREQIFLRVTFHSPDAEGERPEVQITLSDLLSDLRADFYAKNKVVFITFIYEQMVSILLHELKESFKVDGEYFCLPHPTREEKL